MTLYNNTLSTEVELFNLLKGYYRVLYGFGTMGILYEITINSWLNPLSRIMKNDRKINKKVLKH